MEYIELDNDLQFEGPPFTDTEIRQMLICNRAGKFGDYLAQ